MLKELEICCLVHMMQLWNLNEILVNDQNTLFESFENGIQLLWFRSVVVGGGSERCFGLVGVVVVAQIGGGRRCFRTVVVDGGLDRWWLTVVQKVGGR